MYILISWNIPIPSTLYFIMSFLKFQQHQISPLLWQLRSPALGSIYNNWAWGWWGRTRSCSRERRECWSGPRWTSWGRSKLTNQRSRHSTLKSAASWKDWVTIEGISIRASYESLSNRVNNKQYLIMEIYIGRLTNWVLQKSSNLIGQLATVHISDLADKSQTNSWAVLSSGPWSQCPPFRRNYLFITVAEMFRHVRQATLSRISWDETFVKSLPDTSRSSIVSDQMQEHKRDESCSSVSLLFETSNLTTCNKYILIRFYPYQHTTQFFNKTPFVYGQSLGKCQIQPKRAIFAPLHT